MTKQLVDMNGTPIEDGDWFVHINHSPPHLWQIIHIEDGFVTTHCPTSKNHSRPVTLYASFLGYLIKYPDNMPRDEKHVRAMYALYGLEND
jgi:hypothetical protein